MILIGIISLLIGQGLAPMPYSELFDIVGVISMIIGLLAFIPTLR